MTAADAPPVLDAVYRKLRTRAPLDAADRDAILALPHEVRTIEPLGYLVREGERPKRCDVLLSGFAYRQKITADGARQIVAVMIPGDFCDLQNLYLTESDHSVQALTRVTVIDLAIEDLRKLALARPAIGRAMSTDALVDASVMREWLVNIGRRDAHARIGHLLCELALRLEAAGVVQDGGYVLPMTQEQIADTVGLTPVHVNRVLRKLTVDGLIRRDRRHISAPDWTRLQEASDFSARYLHLDQANAASA